MTTSRLLTTSLLMAVFAACAPADPEGQPATDGPAPTQDVPTANLVCEPSEMPLEGRPSPYDSTTVPLGDAAAKICYGRPFAKGRTIFGGLVPYGELWRTGANEPTIIHIPVAASIAGLEVEPGSYSLYTVPGANEWTIIVNEATDQWGHESRYTDEVRAQEVGRATVPAERADEFVEQFTIRSQPRAGDGADLVLEWENTRVRVPIERL